jgi:hypothetical protein
LAAFILSGPSDAMVMPYASVVNNASGDPVNIEAHMTPVGAPAQGLSLQSPSGRVSGSFPPRQPVAGVEIARQQQRP